MGGYTVPPGERQQKMAFSRGVKLLTEIATSFPLCGLLIKILQLLHMVGIDTFHTHRSKGRLILKYMGVDVDYSEHLCAEMPMSCFW